MCTYIFYTFMCMYMHFCMYICVYICNTHVYVCIWIYIHKVVPYIIDVGRYIYTSIVYSISDPSRTTSSPLDIAIKVLLLHLIVLLSLPSSWIYSIAFIPL